MTRNWATPWSQSVRTRTTGGTTSTLGHITAHMGPEPHGAGSDTMILGAGTHGTTADIGEGGTTLGIGIHGTGEDGMTLGTTDMQVTGEDTGDGLITTITTTPAGTEAGTLTGGMVTDIMEADTMEGTDTMVQDMKPSVMSAYLPAGPPQQDEVWEPAAAQAEAS